MNQWRLWLVINNCSSWVEVAGWPQIHVLRGFENDIYSICKQFKLLQSTNIQLACLSGGNTLIVFLKYRLTMNEVAKWLKALVAVSFLHFLCYIKKTLPYTIGDKYSQASFLRWDGRKEGRYIDSSAHVSGSPK